MSSNYGYSYDTAYAAYAGYAAAQYNIMQQQQQQSSVGQVGYGHIRPPAQPVTNTYGGQYQQQQSPQTQTPTAPAAPPRGPGPHVQQQPKLPPPAQNQPQNQGMYNYPQTSYQPSYPTYRPQVPTYTPYGSQQTPPTNTSHSVSTPATPPSPQLSYQNKSGFGQTQPRSQSQPNTGYQNQTYSYPQSVSYPQTSSYQPSYGSYSMKKPSPSTPSYSNTGGYGSNMTNNSTQGSSPAGSSGVSDMTPQQQKVVQQFVQQKVRQGNNAIKSFMKKQPKYQSQEEFYCEVCKIACGSPFAYKAHMAGKNHKKRVQQVERTKAGTEDGSNPFKCDVCDVYCSNKDAFQSHMKGAKHLKTVNLFRKLGKPLPAMTTVVTKDDGAVQVTGPRITFVGGKKLSSTGLSLATEKDGVKVYPPGAPPPVVEETKTSLEQEEVEEDAEVKPVGENLVKPIKGDPRNPHATYICELCDCFFCDDMARLIHCKGRRHRLNYKKKYQPDLRVEPPKAQVRQQEKKKKQRLEMKKSLSTAVSPTQPKVVGNQRGRGRGRGRGRFQSPLEKIRMQEAEALAQYQRDEAEWEGSGGGWEDPYLPRRNPMDDKLLSIKNEQLRPDSIEISFAQVTVQTVEKALKNVSDDLLVEKCRILATARGEDISDIEAAKDETHRQLKGVMRVGLFARSLMLKGQLEVDLIVMCNDKPTEDLLEDVYERLPGKFQKLSPEQIFHVTSEPKKSRMVVVSTVESHTLTINIVLTSTLMREEITPDTKEADTKAGVLDRQSCLASLAALRHTKWFQAMCQGLPSFNYIMRVFLDLSSRHPVWKVLNPWILELLIQKCIVSGNQDFIRPGDIFRRVIECIASGVFLPGGSGLMDPCEKGSVDAAALLTAQERVDLTLTAQHYLRLVAFNQLHLVLDVTPPTNYAPYSLGKCVQLVEMRESDKETEDPDEEEDFPTKKIKMDSPSNLCE